MIVSASRRTDLPAFYPRWLADRFRQGEALVREPRAPHRIRRLRLAPDTVDGIVFWTKNPLPLLPYREAFAGYPFYFQFTLTGYGPDVEPGIPDKDAVLVPVFRQLARELGPGRLVWRYDPIFLTGEYTLAFHRRRFAELAARLAGSTDLCTISFLDEYRDTRRHMAGLGVRAFPVREQLALAAELKQIADRQGMRLCSCAEGIDLASLGILPARCIDPARLAAQVGESWQVPRAAGQRPACRCAQSVDIGAYDSCKGGCLYCYAGGQKPGFVAHDPASALLVGRPGPEDQVTDRPMPAFRTGQQSFW